MNISTLLIFIPACFALNMAPGPNNLLSINNATQYGFWASCMAGTGRLIAFAAMIALAAAGLAVVLETSELVFYAIKILGAAYLFYLAIKLWTAKAQPQEATQTKTKNIAGLAKQEFLIAAGNPKAILIFTAFLPQFINPAQDVAPQFAVLGILFLMLEMIALAGYALIGLHLRRWFSDPKGKRLFNRICAVLLSGAASILLATRRA
ncbi:TPA: LysE family translocator [Pseudomonas putida]|uniref:LysE family translocator n=1 Tax=Pseudomonas putida TaxID=303 RepID=UPI000B156666|nr:LysE family translocator [Pseudomonas putida]MDD2117832.1 LysE family translocator [Pseudomonas putida]UPU94873.1 LysE family translocator [Pseudomonas putida]HDS1728191.1 LysE family translocator [Pseudomonas putida]